MLERIDNLCERVMRSDCDLQKLQEDLAEEKIPANAQHSKYGISILSCAAREGSLPVIKFLIQANFSLVTDLYSLNILEWASENTEDVKRFLLSVDYSLWEKFNDNTSDIHADAMAGREDALITKLFNNPERVNEVNNNFHTPMYYAGLNNQEDIIERLKEAGALNSTPTDSRQLHIQAMNHLGLAYYTRKNRNYPSAKLHFETAILFLEKAYEQNNNFDVDTSILLTNKVNLEIDLARLYNFLGESDESKKYYRQALKTLSIIPTSAQPQRYFRNKELIQEELNNLIQKEEKTDSINLLCEMAHAKDTPREVLAAFINENQININERHLEHKTRPIEFAAQNGSLDNVKFFLEANADCDANDSPLNLIEWAENNPSVLEYLCSEELKLWERFNDGTTDIHADAAAGRIHALQQKLTNERLKETTNKGKTVLDFAKLSANKKVKSFLEHKEKSALNNKIISLEQSHQWLLAVDEYFSYITKIDFEKIAAGEIISPHRTQPLINALKAAKKCLTKIEGHTEEKFQKILKTHIGLVCLYKNNAKFHGDKQHYEVAEKYFQLALKNLNIIISLVGNLSRPKQEDEFNLLTQSLINKIGILTERIENSRLNNKATYRFNKDLENELQTELRNIDVDSLPFEIRCRLNQIERLASGHGSLSIHEEKNVDENELSEDYELAEAIRLSLAMNEVKENKEFDEFNGFNTFSTSAANFNSLANNPSTLFGTRLSPIAEEKEEKKSYSPEFK